MGDIWANDIGAKFIIKTKFWPKTIGSKKINYKARKKFEKQEQIEFVPRSPEFEKKSKINLRKPKKVPKNSLKCSLKISKKNSINLK